MWRTQGEDGLVDLKTHKNPVGYEFKNPIHGTMENINLLRRFPLKL